jgi:hypothetical protein
LRTIQHTHAFQFVLAKARYLERAIVVLPWKVELLENWWRHSEKNLPVHLASVQRPSCNII